MFVCVHMCVVCVLSFTASPFSNDSDVFATDGLEISK